MAAADHYLAAHRAFAGNGAKGAPAWLVALRARGLARFGEVGFPTTRLEDWRFTSVAPILETPFVLARAGARAPAPADLAAYLLPGAGRHRLVFVDGRFAPALSLAAGLPAGVTVTSLADALARDPERVQAHLGSSGADAVSAFSALNTAFLADGVYVHVAAGTILAEPLQVLFLATDAAEPVVAHARTLIVAERLAQVVVVESYAGAEGAQKVHLFLTHLVRHDEDASVTFDRGYKRQTKACSRRALREIGVENTFDIGLFNPGPVIGNGNFQRRTIGRFLRKTGNGTVFADGLHRV